MRVTAMRKWIIFLLITLISVGAAIPSTIRAVKNSKPVHGADGWETTDPIEAGMDPEVLEQAGNWLKKTDITSFILLKDGRIVWEQYYRGQIPGDYAFAYSVTNLMLSAVTGISIGRGELAQEGRLIDYYPEYFTAPEASSEAESISSPEIGNVTLRQLLSNTSGMKNPDKEYFHEVNWVARMLDPAAGPVTSEADGSGGASGENAAAPLTAYLVSGAITRSTGEKAGELANERICASAGMKNVIWHAGPEEYSIGGEYLNMRPMDIARLGQLYLDGGVYQDVRILPEGWVRETLQNGYGLLRREIGGFEVLSSEGEDMTPNLYILPELDMVLVVTSYPGVFREGLSRGHVDTLLTDYLLKETER